MDNEKEQLITDLRRIRDIWKVWYDLYNEKITVENEIKQVEQEVAAIDHKGGGWITAIWIVATILVFFNLGFLWGIGALVVGFFVQGLIDDLLYKNKRAVEKEELLNNKMPPLQERQQTAEEKIDEYRETEDFQFAFRSNYIPEKYNTLETVTELLGYLEDGRADTKKEAFNLYESVQHEKRMEEMQKSIQNATEATAIEAAKQTSKMNDIERNTHSAATAAKINAVASYGAYRNAKKINRKLR